MNAIADLAPTGERVRKLIEHIPTADEIRQRLDQNEAEKKLLKRLLRLAMDRDDASRSLTVAAS